MCVTRFTVNNVGKSAQKITQIRAAFREASQTIRAYKLSLDHGNILGSILGVSEQVRDTSEYERAAAQHLTTEAR